MKKLTSLIFALAMILSIAFVGEMTSSHNPFSADAQVTVKKKRSGGLVGGGKYVYRKAANGTRYVYHKTKRGTVYVGKQTWKGGKYVTSKTVTGTKYTSHKVKRGTKSVFSKTKKVVVGN
jgi:hypothetical protein